MNRIRVAVADDSAFLRQAVARMLTGEEEVVLAGLAASGEELLDHLGSWRPDVIILDLSMPGLGGLATLDALMARRPTPVLILSTHSRKDAPLTIEALHRGALDFIDKQEYSLVDFERLRAALLDKIRQLARHRVVAPEMTPPQLRAPAASPMPPASPTSPASPAPPGWSVERPGRPEPGAAAGAAGRRPAAGGAAGPAVSAKPRGPAGGAGATGPAGEGAPLAPAPPVPPPAAWPLPALWAAEVVLIGASTGGPPAIESILRQLGGDLPVPVVVVQHMPAGFTRSFAERLNACLPLPVREAADDELLAPGTVYVAPGGVHLRLFRDGGGLRAGLSRHPTASAHHPAIDLLFASAAVAVGGRAVAVLLTGMGHDGAAGMAALAHAGAHTIAQDEASAVVYGMPRAAVAAGAVREVVELAAIGARLRELLALDRL